VQLPVGGDEAVRKGQLNEKAALWGAASSELGCIHAAVTAPARWAPGDDVG